MKAAALRMINRPGRKAAGSSKIVALPDRRTFAEHSSALRSIAEQLLTLAAQDDLTERVPARRGGASLRPEGAADRDYLARLATGLIRARRLRETHFNADLFADPAWDMLLDLYVEKCRGTRTSVTSLCIASGVPPTTALRWIASLTNLGIIEREEDRRDRRRAFLQLSSVAERAMTRYLLEAFRYLPSPPRQTPR